MAVKKRFYWLRLMSDFFNQPKIKKLRRIAGGDTYTIIYLKLQLLSLKDDGRLYFEGIEETFSDELALTIDEKPEDVEVALRYLESQGLITQGTDNDYILTETQKLIGSEGYSAERMRRCREKKTSLCDKAVMRGDALVIIGDEEKETETESEKRGKIIECRDLKKKEPIVYFPEDQALEEAFQGYVSMRKQIKKPMTDRAIELAITKLRDMARLPFSDLFDRDMAIEILNQSVMNGWQGLFPIMQKGAKTSKENLDWSKV